ncbi:MAG: sulfur reduction protein DsrE [Crocinitomicaceae bacterium]|nr:sulfur reduction protein DsrE [Crocinitomicaceae bacterium]|tara:strand:- start:1456 stop:1776 length:321 start_codon:yes stop_codon:yes gene_type:complete
MKLGIVIYSDHPETVWNAFRLANFSLNKNDTVNVFLMAKGVEAESLSNNQFDIKEQMNNFINSKGILYACGTCIKIRNKQSTELCPLSTMADLYEIINSSDKIISF